MSSTQAFPLIPSNSPDSDTVAGQAANIDNQYQVAAGATDALTGGGGSLKTATPISGTVFINAAGVDACTLASPVAGAPSAGGNDGCRLTIIDVGGHAHTVTTAANKINGNKHIATFNATVGSCIELIAWNGVWWVVQAAGVALT